MDITEKIKETIRQTAQRLQDGKVTTAESMIPLMEDEKYDNKCLDISYGEREKEKLDIYYPEGEGPFPVFVEVHGGAWYFGQKRSIEFEPFLAGREYGFACVSLGYSLSPEEHYPVPVLEIKSAIRFLRKNAAKFRLDPGRIVLWGGSAGAHLAALAANSCDTGYLREDLAGNDAFSAKPDALVLWYGCFDYYRNGRYLEEWIYENFFGVEDLKTVSRELELSSPLTHITSKACPTFLQHGAEDTVVPCMQSKGYYNALVQAGCGKRCELEILPGCDHADAFMFSDRNVRKMFEKLGNV